MFGTRFDYIRLPPHIGQAIQLENTQIIIGQGPTAIRKIFRNQQYSAFEIQQLDNFKLQLQNNNLLAPEYTDDVLLRYLYGESFDGNKAIEKFIGHLTYLSKFNFELSEDIELFYVSNYLQKKKGAAYIGGRTKTHNPYIVINTNLIELDSCRIVEKALVTLFAIVEEYMLFPGKVESWIVVIQTQNQSTYKVPDDVLYSLVRNLQLIFPNTCEQIFILNPSTSLEVKWGAIEQFISPNTLNKIQFLRKNQLQNLSLKFDSDQLDRTLGGSRVMQSYWPPDPNYYLLESQPPQQVLPQTIPNQNTSQPQIQQSMIQTQYIEFQPEPVQNNYLQAEPTQFIPFLPPQEPQKEVEPEKKKKCICVKCLRDVDEVHKDPKPKTTPPPKQEVKVVTKTEPQTPSKSTNNVEAMQKQEIKIEPVVQNLADQTNKNEQEYVPKAPNLDDTYMSYKRQYDSLIEDSILQPPRPKQTQQDADTKSQKSVKQFGGSSFQKQPVEVDRKEKVPFPNPFFNVQQSQEIPIIQQQTSIYPQSQPSILPQQQYYLNPPAQNPQPIRVFNQPQMVTPQQQPIPQYQPPLNTQTPQFILQPINQMEQTNFKYPVIAPQPLTQTTQPAYTQSIIPKQSNVPQTPIRPQEPAYSIPKVEDFDTQVLRNTKPQFNNYDFSEWDKYNVGNDNYAAAFEQRPTEQFPNKYFDYETANYAPPVKLAPFESYSAQIDNFQQPTIDYVPKPDFGTYRYSDDVSYKPGEYNNVYDYNQGTYIPKFPFDEPASGNGTAKSNQLYATKPDGQQACAIF